MFTIGVPMSFKGYQEVSGVFRDASRQLMGISGDLRDISASFVRFQKLPGGSEVSRGTSES